MVQAIAAEHGGGDFAWTSQAEERTKMWQARHDAAWAAKAAKPGWGMWATDVCVPISRLAECILETQKDIVANGLYAPIVGHVGDGNFHLTMMVEPRRPDLPASAPRRSTTAWWRARWRWAAPAPASTASAWARSSSSTRSTARRCR